MFCFTYKDSEEWSKVFVGICTRDISTQVLSSKMKSNCETVLFSFYNESWAVPVQLKNE